MTARELFEYLNERGEADTPIVVFRNDEGCPFVPIEDDGFISIYADCVELG